MKLRKVLIATCMLMAWLMPTGRMEQVVEIDDDHFPDAQFQEYIRTHCDTDGDGWLSTEEYNGPRESDHDRQLNGEHGIITQKETIP